MLIDMFEESEQRNLLELDEIDRSRFFMILFRIAGISNEEQDS